MHTCKTGDVCIFLKKINACAFISLNVKPKPGSFVMRVCLCLTSELLYFCLLQAAFQALVPWSTASDLAVLSPSAVTLFYRGFIESLIEMVWLGFFLRVLSWEILLFRTLWEQQLGAVQCDAGAGDTELCPNSRVKQVPMCVWGAEVRDCAVAALCKQKFILMPHSCTFYSLRNTKVPQENREGNKTGFGKVTSLSHI